MDTAKLIWATAGLYAAMVGLIGVALVLAMPGAI
jgi:hypothetical protein